MIKIIMKRQGFFHLAEFQNGFFFLFSCEFCEISKNTFPYRTQNTWLLLLLHFLSSLICYLFMQEKAQTNIKGKTLRSRRLQMSFKIAVLKNFEITVKKTSKLGCLFNKFAGLQVSIFIKKRPQHRCFLKKNFKNSYLCRTPHCYYTFSNFYVMIEYFGRLWVQN